MTAIDTQAALVGLGEQPKRENARWFGKRELIATLIGIVIYVILLWFTDFAKLSVGTGLQLRPGIVIPIVFGLVFGPLVGFLIGTLGTLVSDYQLYAGVYWQWAVGSGLMGLVPGIYALRWKSYLSWKDQGKALGVSLLGIIIGMGFASFSTIFLCSETFQGTQCFSIPVTFTNAWETFISAVQVNAISTIILVPILLFNIARLDLGAVDWKGSMLLRRLIIVVTVSAALPIALLGYFLVQDFSGSAEAGSSVITLVRVGGTVIITLLFTLANAVLVAQELNGPLLRLAQAARLMESGALKQDETNLLQQAEGKDEISNLSRVFGKMAQEVIQRETKLRKEVETLKIQIDEQKRAKEVEEITGNEFFATLQERSNQMRARRQAAAERKASGEDAAQA